MQKLNFFAGKKCTYGKKCKFFHPECTRPVSERMKEELEKRIKASSKSVELALQLIKANDDHSPPHSITIRDRSVGVLKKKLNLYFFA